MISVLSLLAVVIKRRGGFGALRRPRMCGWWCMADEPYFDGDPAVDSRRRHLEQVLQGKPRRRRWPWILALVAGGAWTAWRMTRPQEPGSESRQQFERR